MDRQNRRQVHDVTVGLAGIYSGIIDILFNVNVSKIIFSKRADVHVFARKHT